MQESNEYQTKIEAARSRQAAAEKRLSRQRKRLQDLQVEAALAAEPRYRDLQADVKVLRHKRHRLRLAVGRTRYSRQVQLQKLRDTRARIREQEAEEADLSDQISTIEAEVARLMQAALESTAVPCQRVQT